MAAVKGLAVTLEFGLALKPEAPQPGLLSSLQSLLRLELSLCDFLRSDLRKHCTGCCVPLRKQRRMATAAICLRYTHHWIH